MKPIFFPYAFADLLQKRWHLVKAQGIITAESLNNYLRTPLTYILEEVLLKLEERQEESANGNIDIIRSIKKYILNRQGCECSLEKLEAFTGYSKFYISHLFKEKTGSTIGKYVNTIRIIYTAEAEIHGIPYKEIAKQLGFSSIQAFSPWHKKHKKKINELIEWKKRITANHKKELNN